jgi:eukaryotic-like serine/threonine-protein kinase
MRHQPGARVDRFEIIEELGEGAYAETYKALDTNSGQVVVLKSPNPMLFADPAIFGRFKRESEIARSLDHPNVQRSFDLQENRTEPYLVLEFVDGENLRQRVSEMPAGVPVDLAIDWGRQLASVITYLHAHGVTHRDLKPENILVTSDDQLKVADFGTALLEGAKRLTWKHLTEGVGTPNYMSPEQIQGERGDTRSDIYAWGIVMYEFLTGRPPYEGDNWMAVMAGHLTKSPQPIVERNPACPPALDAVVRKAMRRYPEHRYQSGEELLADLDRLDTLDPADFDLSPEAPMGGMAAAHSAQRLWLLVLEIAGGFIAVCALIIFVTVVLK